MLHVTPYEMVLIIDTITRQPSFNMLQAHFLNTIFL